MSWESRDGRGRYYIRNRYENGKVVRVYVGTGPVAEAIAQVDAERHAARLRQRELERADRAACTDAQATSEAAADLVAQLFRGAMLTAGYHLHSRSTWRKRKHGIQPDNPT